MSASQTRNTQTTHSASRAAQAIRAGNQAVIPGDGAYWLVSPWQQAADADPARSGDDAVLAASREAARVALGALPPPVDRLLMKLAPGPLVIRFERGRHGVESPGPPAFAAITIPGHPLALELLAGLDRGVASGRELVSDGVPSIDPAEAAALAGAVVLEAGPLADKPATIVRLSRAPDGWSLHVDRPGVYEERYILRRLETAILFVCTGNTCRSPMAESIARGLLERRTGGLPVRVSSAGTSATSGEPASRQTVEALRSAGFTPVPHRARPLTRGLLEDADVVYTMTGAHREGILRAQPWARDRVTLLDPDGANVPDPVGQGVDVYSATAERLRALIDARLKELDG